MAPTKFPTEVGETQYPTSQPTSATSQASLLFTKKLFIADLDMGHYNNIKTQLHRAIATVLTGYCAGGECIKEEGILFSAEAGTQSSVDSRRLSDTGVVLALEITAPNPDVLKLLKLKFDAGDFIKMLKVELTKENLAYGAAIATTPSPTKFPTNVGETQYPTAYPTATAPITDAPTESPTRSPTLVSETQYPTSQPTPLVIPPPPQVTMAPTKFPTNYGETQYPTSQPTSATLPPTTKIGTATEYPTSRPTKVPTSAPTAYCPVTCEVDGNGKAWGKIYGHKDFQQYSKFKDAGVAAGLAGCPAGAPHHSCNWKGLQTKRVVATHNLQLINERDSYKKHRCYNFKGKCMCECLEDDALFPKFQDGTVAGKNAGLLGEAEGGTDPFSDLLELQQGHRGGMAGQSIQTKASMIKAGTYWKAPNYRANGAELRAVKACCDTLIQSTLAPPHQDFTCADVKTASDEQLQAGIDQLGAQTSNQVLVNWLKLHKCYHHYDSSIEANKVAFAADEALKFSVSARNKMKAASVAAGDFCTWSDKETDGTPKRRTGEGLLSCVRCSKACNGAFSVQSSVCTCS